MPLIKTPVDTLFPKIFSGDFQGFRVIEDPVEGWQFQRVFIDVNGLDFAKEFDLPSKPLHATVANLGESYLATFLLSTGQLSYMRLSYDPGNGTTIPPQVPIALPSGDVPAFKSACFFEGQAVVGGAVGPLTGLPLGMRSVGPGYILWSGIGRLRFDPAEDRTAGFRPVPWLNRGYGTIWFVGPLGQALFVMGDGGYGILEPVGSGTLSGYSFKRLGLIGMLREGLIAGDTNGYVFVNSEFDLSTMNSSGAVEVLGYKEFIKPLFEYESGTGNPAVNISFDVIQRRWFIGNNERCYCLNRQGLFEITQLITSVAQLGEFQRCTVVAEVFDRSWAIRTSPLDMRQRGMKMVGVVESGLQTKSSGTVGVDYKYENGKWQEGPLIGLNRENIVYPRVSATDFKIKMEGQQGFERLDYLKVRVKFDDRRSVRGLASSEGVRTGGDV